MRSRLGQWATLVSAIALAAIAAMPAAARVEAAADAQRVPAGSSLRAAPVWVVRSPAARLPVTGRGGAAARWVRATLDEIRSHRTAPPRAARALALVSVAMNDALVAAGHGRTRAPRAKTVIAGAAFTVLAHLYPDRAAALRSRARRIAGRHPGWRTGRRVGLLVVRRARRDGARGSGAVQPPAGRGVWEPTPPTFGPPLEPLAGAWRTWNLQLGSQLRPPPPPAYGSPLFVREAQEVYDVSRALTTRQARIARFWADGPGTVTPPGHWNVIALRLLAERPHDAAREARLLALLNTAQADAFIACWDAKYTYWSQRPVTVLRRGFARNWTPLLETPPFPSYVSGHATTSGAAARILSRHFPHARRRLRAAAREAAISRLYAGIHFRSDNDAGIGLGRRVARLALQRAR